MSTDAKDRAALLEELAREIRQASAQGVLFGEAVAEQLGINHSDLECLDIVYLQGPVTAGQLAAATGLTTGAITGVIDRLERAGYVQRERDVADRRKVFVKAVPAKVRKIQAFYDPMQQAWMEQLADYTDEQLMFLVGFATRNRKMMVEQTARLRDRTTRKPRRPRS